MPLAVAFWVVMLIWLLFGLWVGYIPNQPYLRTGGGHILLFIVVAILGWAVFGPPVNSGGSAPTYQRR